MKKRKRSASRFGTAAIMTPLLILAWELMVRLLEIDSSALPAPSRVLLEMWRNSAPLQRHAAATGQESIIGLLLAIVAASAVSVLGTHYFRARRTFVAANSFLQKIPLIALAPLIVTWFGFGFPPAAAVSALLCFFPFSAGLLAASQSIPPEVVQILQAAGASRSALLTKIHLPASLPFVSGAMKTAIPLALSGATVTEFVGSDTGLGYMMMNAASKADSSLVFAALSVLLVMALVAHGLVSLIERLWIRWPAEATWDSDARGRSSVGSNSHNPWE